MAAYCYVWPSIGVGNDSHHTSLNKLQNILPGTCPGKKIAIIMYRQRPKIFVEILLLRIHKCVCSVMFGVFWACYCLRKLPLADKKDILYKYQGLRFCRKVFQI